MCKGEAIFTRSHNYLEAEMEDKYKEIIETSIASLPPFIIPAVSSASCHTIQSSIANKFDFV